MNVDLFFIFGSKRGGTTFLRLMLNAHSNISIPKESHFIMPLCKSGSSVSFITDRNRQNIFNKILNGGRFETWNMTKERLRDIVFSVQDGTILGEVLI